MSLKPVSEPNRKQSTEDSVPRQIEFLRTKTQALPQSYQNKAPSHNHSVRLGVIQTPPPPPPPGGWALTHMKLSSESDNSNHVPLGASSLTGMACV